MDGSQSVVNRPLPSSRNATGAGRQLLKQPDVQGLEVQVLFTNLRQTLAALAVVSRLGLSLEVRPRVLIFCALPMTVPLEGRFIPAEFFEEKIRALKRESPVAFSVQRCICRHPGQSLRRLLRPHSLVVIAGKKRWWPSREEYLASRLRKDGHHVLFVDAE
jgi:hypothetical protein